MKQWFYYAQGKQTGPVSEDDLIQMFQSGQLQLDTYVWTEGMKDWRPAGDFGKLSSREDNATTTHESTAVRTSTTRFYIYD